MRCVPEEPEAATSLLAVPGVPATAASLTSFASALLSLKMQEFHQGHRLRPNRRGRGPPLPAPTLPRHRKHIAPVDFPCLQAKNEASKPFRFLCALQELAYGGSGYGEERPQIVDAAYWRLNVNLTSIEVPQPSH